MSTSRHGERFWTVQAIYAEEHGGTPGFAYTTGLADRGLHELHLWDRPTHGDDPGADFALSTDDMGHILNDLADEWVDGSLQVGEVREISLDDGLTTMVVTVEEAVGADSLEAWRARPARVVPLAWSLHRPPRGSRVPVMAEERARYEREVREIAARCDRRVAVTGAPVPGAVIDFDTAGRYGPLSPLVAVHARAVAGCATVDVLIDHALAAEAAVSPGALMGRMSTLARLSGRDEQLGEVHRLAHRVMERLAQRRVWRDRVAEVARACDLSRRRAQDDLADLVGASTMCMLTSLALDDVLPEPMVLAAQGPWRATLSHTGTDPGQRWRCSERAETVTRAAFASMDAGALDDLARTMFGPVTDLLGDDLLVIEGRALTSAVAPPSVTDMVLTPHRAAVSSYIVLQQLTAFAQLMATIIDGAFELDAERLAELRYLLGQLGDDVEWHAA